MDGMSNMFSLHGGKSVASKRWNEIESTLKGKQMQGRDPRGKPSQMKKLTST